MGFILKLKKKLKESKMLVTVDLGNNSQLVIEGDDMYVIKTNK